MIPTPPNDNVDLTGQAVDGVVRVNPTGRQTLASPDGEAGDRGVDVTF